MNDTHTPGTHTRFTTVAWAAAGAVAALLACVAVASLAYSSANGVAAAKPALYNVEHPRVPSVAGENNVAAFAALAKVGLSDQSSDEASGTVRFGAVIRTVPAVGTRVPKGATVTVVISSGFSPGASPGARSPVPSLTGDNNLSALAALSQAGFRMITDFRASPTVPFGQVVATAPPAGSHVPAGSTVIAYISCGPGVNGQCG